MQIRYVFQVVYKHRRKLAEWLDKGKGPWWLRPLLAKTRRQARSVAVWPPPRRATPSRRHRFPAWLKQQGAYWFKPLLWKTRRQARSVAVWPPPRRAPTRAHRFPAWLIQRGAYWLRRKPKRGVFQPVAPRRKRHGVANWLVAPIVAVLIPRRRKRQPVANVAAPRRAPTRRDRFPTWLVQQSAYWISNVRRQRAAKLRRTFLPAAPAREKRRRFPDWLNQQGASWLRRKPKHAIAPAVLPRRKRHRIAAWLIPPVAAGFIPRRRHRIAPVPLPSRHKARPRLAASLPAPPAYVFAGRARRRDVAAAIMPRGRSRARHIAGVLAPPAPTAPPIAMLHGPLHHHPDPAPGQPLHRNSLI